jgi:rhodanese-related sulfurtransferase
MTQTPENDAIPIEIDVQAVKQLIDSKAEFLLVDCREQSENEYCRIEGSQLIPMNETPKRLSELENHRGKRIVIYCHHGGRSLHVSQWLRAQGFDQVQNMTGGIDVWSQEIDQEVPRY